MSSCGGCETIDGVGLKRALENAAADFPRHINSINQMNVFPVPDGDTGTNMYHTLGRAWQEIADMDSAAGQIAQGFAYGALMGARGNSGTILSQLLKGFADAVADAETIDAALLSRACQSAVKLAYAAVMSPVEGTILTVAREAAESLETQDLEAMAIDEALRILIGAAEASLRQTPNLLPILRDAGVVDAGGMGLLCFLRGLGADAESAPPPMPITKEALAESMTIHDDAYGYDLQFLMLGGDLDINRIRHDLARMGDSLLVVGDASTLKVHIHVSNPAPALDYAISCGAALDDVVVENMDLQHRRLTATEKERESLAVVAVADGEGIKAIFGELGAAAIVDGGQTANPSAEDILRGIEGVNAERVVILPNNRNVILTARQASQLRPGQAIDIVASKTPLQGISAMLALANGRESGMAEAELMAQMRAAMTQVCSIEIARATRSARLSGMTIGEGDYLALVDGEVRIVGATMEMAAVECFALVEAGRYELATFYRGAGLPEAEARALIQRLSNAFADLECELVNGGQSAYPLLIGLE